MSNTHQADANSPQRSDQLCETVPSSLDGSSLCYQMEPSKHMLSQLLDHSACHAHHRADHMHPCLLCDQQHTVIDLEQIIRIALMVTPQATGSTVDQAWEAISTIRAILKQQPDSMTVTSQTVFLRSIEDAEPCRNLFHAYFGDRVPATNFIVQPPCGGAALAIEAWAIGGKGANVHFVQPDVVSTEYDGLRWVHCSGITPPSTAKSAYAQTRTTFDELVARFAAAGVSFKDVVRLWLYIGDITEVDQPSGIERYRELNRGRTDFFDDLESRGLMSSRDGVSFFPASTGIGMHGLQLAISGLALQTDRQDVRLFPLENPQQTSAFDYAKQFSAKSPKFSRAMAMVIGDYITTWISGTASIVNAESVHVGDVEQQTEQTIDNIEKLISLENFERHGVAGAGACLEELAKIRVYLKHPEDRDKCAAICERRFGSVPAIYAEADVCRSDLLVEIEGVAFSRRA